MNKIVNLALTRKSVPVRLDVVQYATTPGITFVIEDFTPVGTAQMYIEKPSGLKTYTNCEIDGNKVIFTPTTQAFAEVGVSKCQLEISDNNSEAISFLIDADVEPCIIDSEAIESENEFTALQEALLQVGQYDGRIAALESLTETQGQAITTNATNIATNTSNITTIQSDIEITDETKALYKALGWTEPEE